MKMTISVLLLRKSSFHRNRRKRKRLNGERTNKTYKIGDKVKIRVISANKMLRQIDFEIEERD